MAAEVRKKYQLGEFALEPETKRLTLNGDELHLANRPFQVLLYLIENQERLVSRNELLDKFWDGKDVYDDALRKAVGTIRKTLDDHHDHPQFIETRWAGGYRYIGPIEEIFVHDSSIAEIERTCGVKIVVEEEITNEAKQNENGYAFVDKKTLLKAKSEFTRLAFVSTAVLFLVIASFLVYRFIFNPSNQTASATNITSVHSIAVLPLKNLTGDVNNEYFSDGVTESIITELSRVGELRIISRSSTFTFKGKEIDPREIGKKLSVDALLEGSIQKKGDLLSVNVRLISTKDGRVLWTSQDFERPINTAYELQDTISCNVADELRTELCGKNSKRNTTNGDAYQAYLKGRYHWNKRTGEGIKRSIEFYEQAIAIDSNYALAYAGLADSYVQGIWHVPFAAKEVLPKAKEAALKAIELDDTLAEAHTALANIYELDWNWLEAQRELQRAIELNPRYARAHHVLAFCYLTVGENDKAIASIEHARELDPLNLVINTDKANILFSSNRNDEAFQQWEKTLELDPNFAMAHEHLSIAFETLGNETAAIEEHAKAMELNGKSAEQVAEYRQTASKYGLKEIYRKDLNKLLAQEKRGENVSLVGIALFDSLLGQKDEAFKYLEKMYDNHSAEMVLLKADTRFAPLRSDPRYIDLLKRIGLPE
jgi:TolB-like protein/DNA-binding winged helix-turn-helix (wHTH) protein/lipoprotein NlpI